MPINPHRLKELRKSKKLKQRQIAELLKISDRQYRSYEAGEVDPPLSKAEKLADYFDVSVDYIMGRSDIASTMTASEWFDHADPEMKEAFLDEFKKIFYIPNVAASIIKAVREDVGKEVRDSVEFNIEDPTDVELVGEIMSEMIDENVKEKRPEVREVLDAYIEKIETISPDRFSVHFRIGNKK
jgi:transcriptional regulator with XRE-family HTH domain